MNLVPFRRTKTTEAGALTRAERLVQARRRRRGRLLRTTVSLVAILGSFIGANGASAFWSSHGTGTASATNGTLVAPSSVTATAASKLFPGATVDLSVTLNNTNSYSIRITGISQNGSIAAAGCTTSAVSVPTQTLASPVTVAAGSHTVTIPSSLSMGVTSSSDCQNASFASIPITLTVKAP